MQQDVFVDMAPQSKTMSTFSIPDECCYLYSKKDFEGIVYKACLYEPDYGYKEIEDYDFGWEDYFDLIDSW